MASSITISVRAPAEWRDQLQRAAAERRTTVSALIVQLVQSGLDDGTGAVDGPLFLAVVEELEGAASVASPTEREAALAMARVADAGGMAAVSAVRELRAIMALVLGDDEEDDWLNDLAVPEYGVSPNERTTT